MTLLYLIRHARSRMTGDAAERWPLSAEGQREAGVLARRDFWRKVDLIFSSPEPKALQTAEPLDGYLTIKRKRVNLRGTGDQRAERGGDEESSASSTAKVFRSADTSERGKTEKVSIL